jgi:hypothetical protein
MLIAAIFVTAILPLAYAQTAPPPRVSPADAKDHIGEKAVVCGKVVDAEPLQNGLLGRGKPASFYLDEPMAAPVFHFVAFPKTEFGGDEELMSAFKGKHVCVTGKISLAPAKGGPFILAPQRSQIKIQPEPK